MLNNEVSTIQELIDLEQVGSQSALARELGVSPQAVQQWVAKGWVPPRRCIEIAEKYHVYLNCYNPLSRVTNTG